MNWYVDMDLSFTGNIYITLSQLHKLHRNFFHPSSNKNFNMIRIAWPEEATPEAREILKYFTMRCVLFQRIQITSNRFRVSFGCAKFFLNENIIVYIMYINGSYVVHVVD